SRRRYTRWPRDWSSDVCSSDLAIHASPQSRYRRLLRRKRRDQPKNWQQFLERDARELNVGLGRVISLADRMIENEETTDQLRRQIGRASCRERVEEGGVAGEVE